MANGRLAAIAVMALMGTMVAGCTEPDAAPNEGGEFTSAASPTVDAGGATGSIHGTVVDEEGLPVAGADVAVVEDTLTTRSDPEGRFTFNGVTPGSKRLAVSKIGFDSTGVRVDVVAGEIKEVQIKLIEISVVDPRPEMVQAEGYVTCAFAVPVLTVYPDAVLGICGTIFSQADKRTVTVEVEAGVDESLSEIVWTPNQELVGSGLRSVNSFAGDGVGEVSGESPLFFHYKDYEKDRDESGNFNHFFWAAFSEVDPNDPSKAVILVMEQHVTIYFTKFFNMKMPEGYSAIPA